MHGRPGVLEADAHAVEQLECLEEPQAGSLGGRVEVAEQDGVAHGALGGDAVHEPGGGERLHLPFVLVAVGPARLVMHDEDLAEGFGKP